LERLESTDSTEEEELKCQPFSRTNKVEDHVRGDLKENDTERQHLLTDVELVLCDTNILEEACSGFLIRVISLHRLAVHTIS
jgi:hypothetical protein